MTTAAGRRRRGSSRELLDGIVARAARPDFPAFEAQLRSSGLLRPAGPAARHDRDLRPARPPARVVDRRRARRRAAQGVRQPPRGRLPAVRGALPPGRLPPDRRRPPRRQGRPGHGGRASGGVLHADRAELRARAHAAARRRTGGRGAAAPRRDAPVCPHGVPLSCRAVHDEGDPCLGEPLCPECFDYRGAVVVEQHARRAVALHDDLRPARARAPGRDDAEGSCSGRCARRT